MAVIALIVAGIIAIVGVVLIGIAAAISGIISTQKEDETKTQLLASSALAGFTAILGIVAAILGLLYGGRALAASFNPVESKKAKTYFIIFLIAVIITLILFIAVIAINLVLRSKEELDETQKRSMTAGIALTGVGLLLLIISSIIIFVFARSKLPKGFKSGGQLRAGLV